MSFSTSSLLMRDFVSTGAVTQIPLDFAPTGLRMRDLTNINNAQIATGQYFWAYWSQGMNQGSAQVGTSTGGPPITDVLETNIQINGFSVVDTSNANLGGPFVGTAVSQAGAAVVTMVAHPFVTGDIVQISNTTGMFQIASMNFSVTKTGANTFTLTNMDTSAFAAAATAVTARKIGNDAYFIPRRRFITKMSNAPIMRVTMSVTSGYAVGEQVRLLVPPNFGMTQANGLLVSIVAVGNADSAGSTNTIDVAVNSTAFSPFAFPASFANYFSNFAEVVPVGDNSSTLAGSTLNSASFLLTLGTGVIGALGDQMELEIERPLLF